MTERISEPFKTQGGHTQFDNDVLDHLMPKLSPSEWMVLSFIIRKTKGWHKESDGISYSQFISGTGIASNSTVKKCLDSLVKMNLIMVGQTGHKADSHRYMLNRNYSFRITENVERPVTFSVERPVTKTVDTKESLKKEKQIPAVAAYENTFGAITYQTSQRLYDDIDTYGETAVIQALFKAKEKRAHAYGYVETILRSGLQEKESRQSGDAVWEEIEERIQSGRWNDLTPTTLKIVQKCGGQSAFKFANTEWDIPRLKKQVYSYAQ